MDIKGINALVTGGASGLGRATAEALAARGANVTIFDLPSSAGEEVAGSIGAIFAPGDVTSEEDVTAAIAKAGPIRIAVSCAGIGPAARIVSRRGPFPLDLFRKVI